ncbi:MAG: hypothetical protein HYW15_01130 [Candidatus Giovannonibacteria bacterium]|nr:MAG: hypothetical protein HYW15_01130 [Candidatus Giovannonibacteria bacterium]
MNKKTLTQIAVSSAFALPLFAYAANVTSILAQLESVLNRVIPILMIVATIVFLWGVIRYVTAGGDEEKLADGRRFIIFGLVGLFVMIAIWGVVRAIVAQFGVGGGVIPGGPGDVRPQI